MTKEMSPQEKKLEELILDFVKVKKFTILSLVWELRQKDPSLSEVKIRQMVWRLIDREQISLTRNHRLMVTEEQRK
jgi:hypothetical protein